MRAAIGDRLVVLTHHLGERERSGVILSTGPDDGHEGLFSPGSDALVERLPAVRPTG